MESRSRPFFNRRYPHRRRHYQNHKHKFDAQAATAAASTAPSCKYTLLIVQEEVIWPDENDSQVSEESKSDEVFKFNDYYKQYKNEKNLSNCDVM